MTEPNAYRVLARKYRPRTFSELIGQEALVRILSNAIQTGRLAHAFMLTGVRGVGKTTTARIIARALNCIGADGTGGPTIDPCGVCEHCRSIAEDRHVDVLEMDAASRTGVNDIRELIDGVRYKPTSGRFKIYIIDEVHMLSTNAFNALLKTLEEPPEHVKFIFATTEIRRVPITVLSRCQRFDLRRIDAQALAAHFGRIAEAEGVAIEPAALALIARAADGSARDGLSLLDQAIATTSGTGVTETAVGDMLGLADRTQVFDLFDHLMKGDAAQALALIGQQYQAGADPLVVLQDLLELSHWLTRLKVAPDAADSHAASETERVRGRDMAQRLSLPVLTRAWQMLLKGLGEARLAPSPLQAAEMIAVRLAYAAELPSPAELVDRVRRNGPADPAPQPPPRPSLPPAPSGGNGGSPARAALAPRPEAAPDSRVQPQSFEEVVSLLGEKREGLLKTHLIHHIRLVHFEPGRIELNPQPEAPRDLANRLGGLLSEWTGTRWVVVVSNQPGQPTIQTTIEAQASARRAEAAAHPLVQAILQAFPGASIETVRDTLPPPPAAEETAPDGLDEFMEGDDAL